MLQNLSSGDFEMCIAIVDCSHHYHAVAHLIKILLSATVHN